MGGEATCPLTTSAARVKTSHPAGHHYMIDETAARNESTTRSESAGARLL
jgi:hypothetical protein